MCVCVLVDYFERVPKVKNNRQKRNYYLSLMKVANVYVFFADDFVCVLMAM